MPLFVQPLSWPKFRVCGPIQFEEPLQPDVSLRRGALLLRGAIHLASSVQLLQRL